MRAGREWGKGRIGWLEGITDSMSISWSKSQEAEKDREVWCTAAHGVAELDKT